MIFGFLDISIYIYMLCVFFNSCVYIYNYLKKDTKGGEFADGDGISSELFVTPGQIAQQGSRSHK